jgi:hypothetical protein
MSIGVHFRHRKRTDRGNFGVFFPHNLPMPQLSSTDRLIMAANDMTKALNNIHPGVPFTQVGDDTISALTQLVEIFRNKFQKVKAPELSNAHKNSRKQKTCILGTTNSYLSHTTQTSDKITNKNKHERSN